MALSVFAAAHEAPERLAVLTDERALTYRDLARRVRGAIRQLRSRSLAGADPVALVAEPDLRSLLTLHALIALGTPALLLHPRLTAPERQTLIDAAGVAGVIDPVAPADQPVAPADEPVDEPDPAPPPADDRPLAIIPTSGTSGSPRGVVLSRRAFAASAAASAANLGWRDDDRWLLPLPLAHVGGLSIATRCLIGRRAIVLAPGTGARELVESVARHRATLVSLVPTLLARILDLDPPVEPPPSLRAVLLGGAAASPPLLSRAADRGWPILTTYGLSEACSQVTTQPYGTVNRGELGSGPPLPGMELRIGDDDAIQVRGPTLFSGYLPPDPPGSFVGDGWLVTGDHGRLDEAGNLHVLGRRSDRIVTGGENVDPLEVERGLERVPGIREACVFGAPDPEWGEVVCAALVVEGALNADGSLTGGETDLAERVRALRQELASFKVPRRIAVLATLPRNATGKIDRRSTAAAAQRHLRPI